MSFFKKYFLSMSSAIVLFGIFAFSCAIATIIESVKSTAVAWGMVYGTKWFGFIQLLLGINLIYNIYAYGLINFKKLPSLLFHLSFLFILVGAGITRYFGFEGTIYIKENTQSDIVMTRDSYVSMSVLNENGELNAMKVRENDGSNSGFSLELALPKGKAKLKFKDYVASAGYKYVDDKNGKAIVEIVFTYNGEKHEATLNDGEILTLDGVDYSLNNNTSKNKKQVKFYTKGDEIMFEPSVSVGVFDEVSLKAKSQNKIEKKLYTIEGVNFSIPYASPKSSRKIVSVAKSETDAIVAELSYQNESKEVVLFYNLAKVNKVVLADEVFLLSWGLQSVKLPFQIYLKDFELARYPGSNSPMEFSSYIVVKDPRVAEYEYKIYMNHVLDHDGYRFFQNSYDKDEKGTILSVNKDPGKTPTYIGYFLLGLGFLLNILNPASRFSKLARLVNEANAKKTAFMSLMLFFCCFRGEILANEPYIDKDHASKLAKILVQSQDGRIKPFDTLSRELLNKIHRKDEVNGLNSNQILLSIMLTPQFWQNEAIIAIGNSPELKETLGLMPTQKYARFSDFFKFDGKENNYKLRRVTEQASRKHPGSRTTFDKEAIKADERVNVFYYAFMGEFFNVFPKKNDPNNAWYSPYSAMMNLDKNQGSEISLMMKNYFESLDEAIQVGEENSKNEDIYAQKWDKANKALDEIINYQNKFGAQIIPSKARIYTEILFNKLKIFDRLTSVYLLSGFVLLIFVFVKMLAPRTNISKAVKYINYINIAAFALLSFGLLLRWYIAQHAPWSNSYESMIYIAWALGLSGLVFAKHSPIAISLTYILAGVTLFVAHLSWLDPQITNLVPVLKSYWLTIHVSVITASYGFLGLCALLGFFVLVLICLQNSKKPKAEISRNITEATRINEMAMILGISLLTLGNFLGGVWANESWGRYWGWDSKETWSLISILVYAIVLHLRFVPKFNNQFVFAVASMFAYWSILMTYFGVNFYLSGMHSYASGDPIPIPNFIYVIFAIMCVLSVYAYTKRKLCARL
ncbi:MAG: cytochrome c biogenesis protein CcsA [Campylobacter sp.]|nr:cytochrome c biogenesis protein CcsA [Campylobacter sp.]